MTIGGRPVPPMVPMPSGYHPPSASSTGVQQLPPQVPKFHASGDVGGQVRPLVQPGGQKQLLPGHSSAVPVVATCPPQPQVNLGDITASTMSLADIAPQVKSLGFPSSSRFVLGTVERYVCVCVLAGVCVCWNVCSVCVHAGICEVFVCVHVQQSQFTVTLHFVILGEKIITVTENPDLQLATCHFS